MHVYSSMGRVFDKYSRSFTSWGACLKFLRMKLRVDDALKDTASMWPFQIRSAEKITPKYLTSFFVEWARYSNCILLGEARVS